MIITTYFTLLGAPATGLTPKIDVWDVLDASHDVNNQNMTEIDGGFYQYDFAGYAAAKDYVIRCDGTVALPNAERYSWFTNEPKFSTDAIQTVVDDNATKIARILGLSQENYVLSATTYVNNRLTIATLKTYPTHADADADTNAIAEYEVTASYDGNGDCNAYKVVKA